MLFDIHARASSMQETSFWITSFFGLFFFLFGGGWVKTGKRLTGSLPSAAKDAFSVFSLKMFLKIATIMPLVLDVPISLHTQP
jgi:hypothetical protein